jgi:hypothetical protein
MKATLKYVDTNVVLDASLASWDSTAFSMRNLYDPDTRAGGHQPSNFDRLVSIYNRWTVLRTRVKLSPSTANTSALSPSYFGMWISRQNSTTGIVNGYGLLEQPYVVYSDQIIGVTSNNVPTLAVSTRSSDWTGVNNKDLQTFDYSGDSAGGPGAGWDYFCHIFSMAANANDPGSQSFKIEIEYDTIWYEPQYTLQS